MSERRSGCKSCKNKVVSVHWAMFRLLEFEIIEFVSLLGILVAGNPNMVTALAGNKADLEDKRKVSAEVSG